MGAQCSNCETPFQKSAAALELPDEFTDSLAHHEEVVSEHKPQQAPGQGAAPELSPEEQARALVQQGSRELRGGRLESAEATYGRALDLSPGEVGAWAGRGSARLRRGDFAGALGDLDRAMELDPNLLYVLSHRADAKTQLGDLDGAISDYNQYLSMAPADAENLCQRGKVKLTTKDAAGAAADLGLAVRLGHSGAKELLSQARKQGRWAGA